MKIGNLKISNPLFLAPMAGITDQPFRVLCRNMGAGVVYTEFVSSNGIIRENMKTLNLMKFAESERPIGIQIFGEDPETLGKSAKMINDMFKPDLIDINYGCPVPKVTKKGGGSAALKDLCLMDEMTLSVIEAVPTLPVTVKMRLGWDYDNIVSTEAAIRLEKIGVSAITLHARTTKQQFSGNANWNFIKEMKSEIKIPVIGNGDVKNYEDYIRIMEETGCDGVMIGRAALGNPWIFNSFINHKNIYNVSIKERISIAYEHFLMLKDYYQPHICINHTKKHFSWYFKGFDGASSWRKKLMGVTSITSVDDILSQMQKQY